MHFFYKYGHLPVNRQIGRQLRRSVTFLRHPLTVLVCWVGIALFGALSIQIPAAIASPTTPSLTASPPIVQSATTPAALFEENCAGCHVNGRNVIRRGKNLKKKAMVRNGYESVEAIAQIITQGKGIMSAYGDRLNEEEISAIAQYVHDQSEAGW